LRLKRVTQHQARRRGRTSHLESLGLDELDDLDRALLDPVHVFSVTVLTELGRRSNDDVEAINAGLDRELGVIHVAPDMGQDFGLQAKLADGFAVLARLLRCSRRG
jgi:hypothetical protein